MRVRSSSAGWSITDAVRDLRAVIRTSGALPEGDDSRAREWRLLRTLAEERGYVREHDPSLTWRAGGSQHLCRRVEGDRWEKATHENGAGWWIDFDDMRAFPASPLEYLRRLELVNAELQDDVQLEAIEIGPSPDTCRFITTQPHVPGESPSPALLHAYLESYGFDLVRDHKIGAYDAVCCRRGDLWLFDVRPANFALGADGVCYPIDVLVQRASDQRALHG